MTRSSRVIQPWRAVLTKAADSSLIWVLSEMTATRCSENVPFMAVPYRAWASVRRRCQQPFGAPGELVLVPGQHALQR